MLTPQPLISFLPKADHPAIKDTTAAPKYSSSSKKNGPSLLEPDATPDIDYEVENEEDLDIDEETDDANEADCADPPLPTSPYQEYNVFIDATGDADPCSPTQKSVHQTINRADDPLPSTVSVGVRPFAIQGAFQAQGDQADANALDPIEALEGATSVFTYAEKPQSKHSTVRSQNEREKRR